jgi:hypothetical protein
MTVLDFLREGDVLMVKRTALLHHINIDVLRTSFFGLKRTAARVSTR